MYYLIWSVFSHWKCVNKIPLDNRRQINLLQVFLCVPQRSLLTICLCPKTLQQTAVMLNLFKLGNSAVPLQRHQATKIYTRNFCLAINGTEWDKKYSNCVYLGVTVALTMQGPPAGGETRAETGIGAAQTGAAQGGGDGTTATIGSGDGAPQEAAKAAGGQDPLRRKLCF